MNPEAHDFIVKSLPRLMLEFTDLVRLHGERVARIQNELEFLMNSVRDNNERLLKLEAMFRSHVNNQEAHKQ